MEISVVTLHKLLEIMEQWMCAVTKANTVQQNISVTFFFFLGPGSVCLTLLFSVFSSDTDMHGECIT